MRTFKVICRQIVAAGFSLHTHTHTRTRIFILEGNLSPPVLWIFLNFLLFHHFLCFAERIFRTVIFVRSFWYRDSSLPIVTLLVSPNVAAIVASPFLKLHS